MTFHIQAALITLGLSTLSAPALEVAGHGAPENDRFANDGAFIADSFSLSGVGRSNTGTAGKGGHWVTMISENVFLSAAHYHAPTGTTLWFYPDNDPSGTAVTRTISGAQKIGSSDLWVGHLDSALPSNIHYFNWANETISTATFAASMVALENAYVTGITPTSTSYGSNRLTNMAVGRNVIDNYNASLSAGGNTGPVLVTTKDEAGDAGITAYETQLQSGDSGAPLFIEQAGSLTLVGINWAVGTVDIQPGPLEIERESSYYSYVGNHATEIRSYIDANPVTVPEPSSLLLLCAAGLGLTVNRRRP